MKLWGMKMANEKRLIDAHQFRGKHEVAEVNGKLCSVICYADIVNAPTVDAVEVVHGYWIDGYNVDHIGRITEHTIDCSVCDSVFKDDSREVVKHWKERFKVCPFCGAIMDGGNEDG